MSPSVVGEILGVFVNTLSADGKYPVQYCENLKVQFQMQLSEKRKTFPLIFLESYQILNILRKKIVIRANVFPKLQAVKIYIRPLCKKRRFKKRFDIPNVKASQILAKSPCECFYHVFSSF